MAEGMASMAAWGCGTPGVFADRKMIKSQMNEFEEKLVKSIELAKSGFENTQARIGAIDAKVGVAVGFLVFLLPAPLMVVGWLSGLQSTASLKYLLGLLEVLVCKLRRGSSSVFWNDLCICCHLAGIFLSHAARSKRL